MMVYVAPGANNGIYHTDEDCPALDGADPLEKEKNVLGGKTQCKLCKGIDPGRNAPSHKNRNMLLETNVEEVGL